MRKKQIENLKTLSLTEIKELTAQTATNTQYHTNLEKYLNKNSAISNDELKARLFSIAGQTVNIPDIEEDLHNILTYGQLWTSKPTLMRGKASQCHKNSCDLWYENKDKCVICTGYALSDDEIWRQHSWLIHIKPRSNLVIETTIPRLAYYGFAMTYDLCVKFDNDNL
jgi:hypothetical protein